MNELLLIGSLIFIFGMILVAFRFWGKDGLYAMSAVVTILANVEAMLLIHAFGMEQTLGNVLFAATFLITDILSECEGKKEANKAVCIGVFASLFFLLLSQSWLLYVPSAGDTKMEGFRMVFRSAPRMVLASLVVYAVSQFFDVWLYHKWWNFTEKKFGDKRKYLWLRNNGATLISQILNTVLFNVAAFWGTYDAETIVAICCSSYVLYVFTSLADTPVVYAARRIHERRCREIYEKELHE